MIFNHIDKKDKRGLVRSLFKLSFSEKDIPFQSIILPQGYPTIAYIFGNKQSFVFNKNEKPIKELVTTGQFYGTYNFIVNDVSSNIGIVFYPTALYKIFKTDISKLTNKITPINQLNKELTSKFNTIFLNYSNDITNYQEKIIELIDSLNITLDKDVLQIDKAINYIIEKDGLVQVNDLLDIVSISQKSLETKFKKIVGLTPIKFIRQFRFMNLMQKYQSKEIDLTDLIYMFDYYDHSHFNKDFLFFMNETPKSFFNQDYPLLKEYLNN